MRFAAKMLPDKPLFVKMSVKTYIYMNKGIR